MVVECFIVGIVTVRKEFLVDPDRR